jgi:hypothetical protein
MTEADSANALRMSLIPSEGSAAETVRTEDPSLGMLRAHAFMCERCAVGAPCATGASLTRAWATVLAEHYPEQREQAARRAEVARLELADTTEL